MKNSLLTAAPAASLALALSLVASGSAFGQSAKNPKEPRIPVGTLDAYPTLVQTGTHPTLTWDIQYPESARDIITCDPDDPVIKPKVDLCLELRVVGASYQTGWDKKGRPVYGYLQAEASGDSGQWVQFFYDTQNKVKPNFSYGYGSLRAGSALRLRARAYSGSYWLDWVSTESAQGRVVALVHGDSLPDLPAFNQDRIQCFLKPYVNGGGFVNIGPKDVLFLFELDQTDPNHIGYDLQDMAILGTFDYCKNNNGHGNNVDGVDVSNPGNGGGGPNGEDDPSGPIDDEIR